MTTDTKKPNVTRKSKLFSYHDLKNMLKSRFRAIEGWARSTQTDIEEGEFDKKSIRQAVAAICILCRDARELAEKIETEGNHA